VGGAETRSTPAGRRHGSRLDLGEGGSWAGRRRGCAPRVTEPEWASGAREATAGGGEAERREATRRRDRRFRRRPMAWAWPFGGLGAFWSVSGPYQGMAWAIPAPLPRRVVSRMGGKQLNIPRASATSAGSVKRRPRRDEASVGSPSPSLESLPPDLGASSPCRLTLQYIGEEEELRFGRVNSTRRLAPVDRREGEIRAEIQGAAPAMASSGLAYPDRFYAAAAYAGFGVGEATSSAAISRFQNDVALLLYGLHQQVKRQPFFFYHFGY
jgi:hypothetical protein